MYKTVNLSFCTWLHKLMKLKPWKQGGKSSHFMSTRKNNRKVINISIRTIYKLSKNHYYKEEKKNNPYLDLSKY